MISFLMLYVATCTYSNSEWLSIKTVPCHLADKPQFMRQELVKYTTLYLVHTVSANSDLSCELENILNVLLI